MWDFSINYLATGNLHTGLPREMQVFLIAIMILLGGITTTRAAFVSSPMSVNATLGSTATFNCSSNASGVTFAWLVNGSVLTDLSGGITAQQHGKAHFLHIPAREEYNNTFVVCELTIRDSVRSVVLSNPAVLRVQGLLSAVKNLTVHSQWSSILLTWSPPFSLDITGVNPDLWYCVEVYNISWGSTPLTTNCSVYEPQLFFITPNHSPCDLFEFRVVAVNAVGYGSLTSVTGTFHTKPAPDAVHVQLGFISIIKMELKLLFLSSVDICNGQVFATNMTGSTSLGGVEGTGISNLVVHVTDCTLQFNHNYTMTMEVGEGDRSVLRLGDLSTFDIKTVLVNTNSTGAVNVICTFATNSQALGCLVVLHPWNRTQTEIFAYAARDNRHTPTANITIHGVSKGKYTMLVFDGEYNGLLSERPAIAPQNITVTAGGLEPLRENPELSASINTTKNQICVSCPDDGVSRGCVIVLCHSQELQSTISYEILRSEGERCFRQEKSGDYTVAVFKQTINKTLHAIPLNVSVVSVSFSTPTTYNTPTTITTDNTPTTRSAVATLEIAVVVTGASAFVVGVLAGALLYHCTSKHQSQLKPESSSYQQQQTDPEYEMPATSGKEIELRKNMAYESVQRIELRGNVAYEQH